MADLVAHHIEEPGQACYYRIVENFGSSILNSDTTINRQRLAGIVFEDETKRLKLNQIVHPLVKEYIIGEIEKERRNGQIEFFIIEAALLLEDKYEVICDEVWYIHSKDELRRERLKSSRGYSDEKIDLIMKSQMKQEEFESKCDKIIDNNLSEKDTFAQIDAALREGH
jgi:dephospho-CoA kinase